MARENLRHLSESSLSPSLNFVLNTNPDLQRAFTKCKEAHDGINQKRADGQPYHTHPFAVTKIFVEEWGVTEDTPLLQASFLHDADEDTNYKLAQIKNDFGSEVASLVRGVSQLQSSSIRPNDKKSTDRKTLQKVAKESSLDPRVLLLKLADRLHNMRTLGYVNPKKGYLKAKETIESYVPMAESLGIWKVKKELEDLGFKYINPNLYERIKNEIDNDPRLDKLFIEYLTSTLKELIKQSKIDGSISVSVGGYWEMENKRRSTASKGLGTHDSFRWVNDILSVRTIFDSWPECYQFLWFVHNRFGQSVEYNRFDEFVGPNLRLNGYQALQTTIEFPSQGAVEIAITTREAEEFNNWGVISLIRSGQKDLTQYVRKIIFTQSGQTIFTQNGATGIDVAYTLNPKMAADAEAINVDGEICPMSSVMAHGSQVEIIFGSPRRAPPQNWLDYCLPSTRKIIESQILQQQKDKLIEQGSEDVEGLLIRLNLPNLEDLGKNIRPLLYRLACGSLEDMYFKVGFGSLGLDTLQNELKALGITKENLGLTTIRIAGPDQPGILDDVAGLIRAEGGNIINLKIKNENGIFELRFVIEKLTLDSERQIENIMSTDNRFSSLSVS